MKKILIIDDSLTSATALQHKLAMVGIQSDIITKIVGLSERVNHMSDYEMAFVDINMPISGDQVVGLMTKWGWNLPVVFWSTEDRQKVEALIAKRTTCFLPKDASITEMVAQIKKCQCCPTEKGCKFRGERTEL